jgi:hypothetical protein
MNISGYGAPLPRNPARTLLIDQMVSGKPVARDFVVPQGYRNLLIDVYGRTRHNFQESAFGLSFNNDTSGLYTFTHFRSYNTSIDQVSGASQGMFNYAIMAASLQSSAGLYGGAQALVIDYAAGDRVKIVQARGFTNGLSTNNARCINSSGTGIYKSKAPITSFRLQDVSGTAFEEGVLVRVWGLD